MIWIHHTCFFFFFYCWLSECQFFFSKMSNFINNLLCSMFTDRIMGECYCYKNLITSRKFPSCTSSAANILNLLYVLLFIQRSSRDGIFFLSFFFAFVFNFHSLDFVWFSFFSLFFSRCTRWWLWVLSHFRAFWLLLFSSLNVYVCVLWMFRAGAQIVFTYTHTHTNTSDEYSCGEAFQNSL